jgi:hypothetical protein
MSTSGAEREAAPDPAPVPSVADADFTPYVAGEDEPMPDRADAEANLMQSGAHGAGAAHMPEAVATRIAQLLQRERRTRGWLSWLRGWTSLGWRWLWIPSARHKNRRL